MVTSISAPPSDSPSAQPSATSAAQLRANRRNARKSTGPKTPEGKVQSSKNAFKHGIFSVDIVVEGEDPADFCLYRSQILRRFNPREPLELQFAEQFIRAGWKLRRLQLAELELYDDRRRELQRQAEEKAEDDDEDEDEERQARYEPELTPGIVMADLIWDSPDFDRFGVHEQRLSNVMHRAMNQFRKLREEEQPDVSTDFTGQLIDIHEQSVENQRNEANSDPPDITDDPATGSHVRAAVSRGESDGVIAQEGQELEPPVMAKVPDGPESDESSA